AQLEERRAVLLPDGLHQPRLLLRTLQIEQARLRALQACGRARHDAALSPFAARMRYLNARAAREGTDRQKTESIADLWLSTWWCEVAVVGGR
ncbi:MAG: hypothetical protein IAE78_27060, partial [Myxococcus sp.]|nr:hypothetical protein [Myxococcus sp.]